MVSIDQVQAVVHKYPTDFWPARVEPLGAAGGMSGARFWRIESESGALALRRWPVEHPSAERLRFIHDVLFHAARRGVTFLAVPIATSAGESFVSTDGHLWEISPWMPGVADYERSPNVQKLSAATRALATFHVAVADFPMVMPQHIARGAPAVSRRLSRLRELSNRGTNDLSQAASEKVWPELAQLAHRFLGLLPSVLPRAIEQIEPLSHIPLSVQPCIRDIWHDHVLFTGDNVTGIIDFGAMDIDTPATDVSRLLSSLVGDDDALWRTGLTAYSSIRLLTKDEERAAKAFDTGSTILAGCNWIEWICFEGRQFEDHSRVTERFRQIVARCEFAAARLS